MTSRRVAVTGIGPVTPIGTGVEEFWQSLASGRSGIGPLTRFDTAGFSVKFGGEVRGFDPGIYMDARKTRRIERFAQFGYAASVLALEHAGLKREGLDPERTGVVIGTGYAGMDRVEVETLAWHERGWKAIPPEISMSMMPNVAAGFTSMELGVHGPVECVATACASGAQAIARGFDLIKLDQADVMLAGGCDAALTPMAMGAFAAARALSQRNDNPQGACQPFGADRDGFVLSEGGCVLVLEEMSAARARGAEVLAEVVGYGHTGDAYNLAQPRPDGMSAALAMRGALRMAGLAPGDVGYINAHAAGTPSGDAAEVRAFHTVFGSSPPPASSSKSMHGHLMGGTGSTEAAAAVLALARRMLPPTINLEHQDPALDIDAVPLTARQASPRVALTNSFAMGGINCTLAFARD